MKDRIKKHVDDLFSDIYETKQLDELKEEIRVNLMDKIIDLMDRGHHADDAFQKAVSNLGDMSELVGSLKKASESKINEDRFKPFPIDKEHVIGYVVASVCLFIGLMVGGIAFFHYQDLLLALEYVIPFVLVAAPIFIYFGLTQESNHEYGMKSKRALTYSVASEIALLGIVISGIEYFQGTSTLLSVLTLMPFVFGAAIIFIYLGLTEKSRIKMNSEWEKNWINYYSDPQSVVIKGNITGALWILSMGAFFFIGFAWSWKYSWIVFVAAIVITLLIEAYFASKSKDNH